MTLSRTVQSNEPVAAIVLALSEAIKTISLEDFEPYELVEEAIESGVLEIANDLDFLRCVDIAQDLIQIDIFAREIASKIYTGL